MSRPNIYTRMRESLRRWRREGHRVYYVVLLMLTVGSCTIEPPLHTVDPHVELVPPTVDLELEVLWDYLFHYDVEYEWEKEWWYGWDSRDEELFGKLGYTEPKAFEVRRYFTQDVPYGRHDAPLRDRIEGQVLQSRFDFGFWDILVWNEIYAPDGVQSIRLDESTTYEYVKAYTGQTMRTARYGNTLYTRSFYQPEELFADYEEAIEINENLDGFTFDPERNVWVRRLEMRLQPLSYIYLPQLILHHNNANGRKVTGVDGDGNLSGMARAVIMNTGVTTSDAITVNFSTRMKQDLTYKDGEQVDIVGAKLLTFGITNLNPGDLDTRAYDASYSKVLEADKGNRHYLDMRLVFNNGADSTIVFDVTDEVRRLFKGGVITVELDMDTVPVPNRGGGSGGSGMDAVVEDEEEEEWEFDM